MLYRRLADLVVLIHLAVACFFLWVAFPIWVHTSFAILHVPLAVWVCSAHLMSWTCPLTPLEKRFRIAAGAAGYESSFVEKYIVPIIAPNVEAKDTRKRAFTIGLALSFLQVSMYVVVVGRLAREYHNRPQTPRPFLTTPSSE